MVTAYVFSESAKQIALIMITKTALWNRTAFWMKGLVVDNFKGEYSLNNSLNKMTRYCSNVIVT